MNSLPGHQPAREALPAHRLLLRTHLAAGAFLLLLFLAIWWTGKDPAIFIRDPVAIIELQLLEIQRHPEAGIHALAFLDLPFYTGLLAYAAALLWCATAAVCFFSWALLRGRENSPHRKFLLVAGIFTTVLLLDDLFLLHERLLPRGLPLGENFAIAVYALLLMLQLAVFRRAVRASKYPVLGAALVWFLLFVLIDLAPWQVPHHELAEDSFKFLGIVHWMVYHVLAAAAALSRNPQEERP